MLPYLLPTLFDLIVVQLEGKLTELQYFINE
jgi:hypothetical protein